ncbi:MAG: hypothetical protein ACJ780_32115 [Solirubrobacteraceae bacterium]
MPPALGWKLALALILVIAIATSACARAPRRSADPAELRRLVICALGLYAIGGLATLTHHPVLAGLVYATGISVAALAAWLSRGRDQEDPPGGGSDPGDEHPPPGPDGLAPWDWDRFERDFRDYARLSGSTCAPPTDTSAPPTTPGR